MVEEKLDALLVIVTKLATDMNVRFEAIEVRLDAMDKRFRK